MRNNRPHLVLGLVVFLSILIPAEAVTLQSDEYYVWGINADEVEIPVGSIITEAVLTIQNPSSTDLYVHLLDNPDAGVEIPQDQGLGNVFDGFGVPLRGRMESGSLVFCFSQINDADSDVWKEFQAPFIFTLADNTTVQYTSSLLNLIDYVGTGRSLGIGIDSDGTNSESFGDISLKITATAYTAEGTDYEVSFTVTDDSAGIDGPVLYEAENAVLNGVQVLDTIGGYTGTGFADYINSSNDYIEWAVNAPVSGQYELEFRYALGKGDRPLQVRVNGTIVAASMSFPATGSWDTWNTVSIAAALNAGANTVRATAIGYSGANVDSLNLIPIPAETAAPTPNPMTFIAMPTALSSSSILMTATTASDDSGVEYFFDCISGAGGHDSGWQDSPTYTDKGLNPNTQYAYRVAVRDKSINQNQTAFSAAFSATTFLSSGTLVGTYEAENAVLNGVQVLDTFGGYNGTGFVDYLNPDTDYIQWTVNAPVSGQYEFEFRYALGKGDRPLQIRVNGTVIVDALSFPATGSWDTWDTVSIVVTLNAGANTVRSTAIGSSGANVDSLSCKVR